MQEQEYMEQRIDDQITWLSARSAWNQRLFKRLRLAEVALASLIPVVVTLPLGEIASKVIVASAGAAIATIAAAVSLWRFQELWVQYRGTAEGLKREKFCYLTRVAPYDTDDRLAALVGRVESLLGAENAKWVELAKTPVAAPAMDTSRTPV